MLRDCTDFLAEFVTVFFLPLQSHDDIAQPESRYRFIPQILSRLYIKVLNKKKKKNENGRRTRRRDIKLNIASLLGRNEIFAVST